MVTIVWQPQKRSGVRLCSFRHSGKAVEMSASAAAQREWSGDVDSVAWLTDRDSWAQIHADLIIVRRDFAASPAGRRAVAKEEYDRQQDDIDKATLRRAELIADHPDLEGGE